MADIEPRPTASAGDPAPGAAYIPRTRRPGGVLPACARFLGARQWLMHIAPLIMRIERVLRGATGNRWSLVGMGGLPSVRVTVPGRRTGLPRTTALLAVPLGDEFLVTGSNWGRRHHPAWVFNLGAASIANVELGHTRLRMAVHEITTGERAQCWADIVHYWPGYAMEQRLAPSRPFRMFILAAVPSAGAGTDGECARRPA